MPVQSSIQIRFLAGAALVAAVTFAAARPASAQNIITFRAGAGGRSTALPTTKVTVPLIVDMSAAGGAALGSLSWILTWGLNGLTFDSVRTAGFGTLTANVSNAPNGSISMLVIDPVGTTATATVANAYFTATAGSSTISLSPTAAGSDVGANILAMLRPASLGVCVGPSGNWGDANADGAVNIIDAQQIARSVVGLSVANAPAVTTQGDVTGDGVVNVIDAQQISRYVVGLSAPPRTDTPAATPPVVASLTLAGASDATPGSPTFGNGINLGALVPGQQAQAGAVVARDASGTDVSACAPITYTSTNTALATVSASGLITALGPGTPNINVSGGSGPTRVYGLSITGTLAITAQPAGAESGVAFTTQPSVTILGLGNAPASGATNTVTATLATGSGTLSGTTTVAAVNGVASFSNLKIAGSGSHSLQFTSASSSNATSGGVTVVQVPRALAVTMQPPAIAGTNGALGTVTVDVADAAGLLIPGGGGFNGNVTAQIGSGTGILSGTTSVALVAGIATLTNLGITGTGVSALTFTSAGLLPATSYSVSVGQAPRVSNGFPQACGLSFSGAAVCWNTASATAPVAVTGLSFAKISSSAASDVCGIDLQGAAYCWGTNTGGVLGNGTTVSSATPVAVIGGLTFTTIGVGSGQITTGGCCGFNGPQAHACGVTTNSATYCWGTGGAGQLGSTTVNSLSFATSSPLLVSGGLAFSSVETGYNQTCALRLQRDAYCTAGTFGAPVVVPGGLQFVSLASGTMFEHMCGLTVTGAAYCWGLGFGSTPVLIAGALVFRSLTVGYQYTCGVTTTGAAYCWGANGNGQLGDGTTTSSGRVPVAVTGGLTFLSLSAGNVQTVGVTTSGAVYQWPAGGSNNALGPQLYPFTIPP